MSETAIAATGAPASETQEGQRQHVEISSLDDAEQLRAILRNPAGYTDDAEEETPVEETEGESEEEKTEEEPKDEKPEEEEEQPEHRPERVRLRVGHLDDAEQKVLKLVSAGKMKIGAAQEQVFEELIRAGHSGKKAEEAVYGGPRRNAAPEPQREAPKQEDAPQVSPAQKAVKDAETKLTELKAQLEAARGKYNVDDMEKIRDEIDEARWTLKEAKDEARREEDYLLHQAQSEFDRAVNDSLNRVGQMFPEAVKEGTELFEAIQDRIEIMRAKNPSFFNQDDWPELLAAIEAAKLGTPPSQFRQKASEKPAGKQPASPKKVAQKITPSSGTPGQGTTQTITVESEADVARVLQAAGDDPEKLREIMRQFSQAGKSRLPMADALAA